MIKGIIFDMDGVLINSEDLYKEYEYNFFKNLAKDADEDFINSFRGTATRHLVKAMVEKHNIQTIPADKILEMLDNGGRTIYEQHPKLALCNGVLDWLKYFQSNGYKMVIASSNFKDNINYIVERFGLENYFEGFIGGDEVKNTKPDPEIFLKAADMLGLKPEECLVIEDSTNGLKAANSAGCKSIGYLSEGTNTQDLTCANLVFDKFGEEKIEMLTRFLNKF